MAHILVEYLGQKYHSVSMSDDLLRKRAEDFYRWFPVDKFQMELDNGVVLVMGKAAIQNAVFQFIPTEK